MPEISAESLFLLAKELQAWAQAVHNERNTNNSLGSAEERELNKLENELEDAAAQLNGEGVAVLGTLAATHQERLLVATLDAEKLRKKIERLDKSFGVATRLVGLAEAVLKHSPVAILTASKGVIDAVKHTA